MARIASEQTKVRVIEAALRVFLENGAHNSTFQMVANEVGFTQAALYKHFKTKDSLIAACCLYAADRGRDYLFSLIPDRGRADKRFRAYVTANLKWSAEKRLQSHALLALHYFAGTSDEVRELNASIHRRREEVIAGFINQGNDEGIWSCPRAERAARHIQSLMVGEMIRACTWPKEMPLAERSERLWRAVLQLVKGSSEKQKR